MIISGFSFGAQIIMARRNGEQNFSKIGAVLYQGSLFLVFASIILIILSKLFSPIILKKLISDQNVFQATIEYLDWRIFGLMATSVLMMLRSFFISIAKTFILQISSIVMVISNIILNYVLIFGIWIFPQFGIKGAAIASVLSEICAVLTFIIYILLKIDVKKYGLKCIIYKDFVLLRSVLDVSVWTMLQQFVSVFTWFLFFIAIEHLGTAELAISNILKNSAGFPWVLVVSFGVASSTITSNLIGENRSKEVLKANQNIIRLNTFCLSVVLLIFAVFYPFILRIYTNDYSLINEAVLPYMTALICFLPLFSGWIWFQAVSATGHTKYSMFIEFISMIFYLLFVWGIIYELKMPLYICMFADGLYNLIILIFSYHFMHSLKWMGKKV